MMREFFTGLRKMTAYVVGLSLLGIVALLLCRVPLFNVLGYEFCFVLALVASAVAGHLGVVYVHRARRDRPDPLSAPLTPLGTVLRLYWEALQYHLLLLVLPFAIIAGNAVSVRNCDFWGGVGWFLVLPLLSTVIATAWGVGMGLAFRRRWLSTLGFYLVLVGSILWGVVRFYTEPPVVQYDPFAGYFAGNFYDTDLSIGASVVGARIYHLMGAATVLLCCARFYDAEEMRLVLRVEERRRWLSGLFAGGLVATVGLYFLGGPMAYTTSARDIARVLGGEHHSPHFIIYYPSGSLTELQVRRHAADAEFHWQQLARFFGSAPSDKIRIYYFRDNAQKRRLFGASQVDMAKPWRLEVALTLRSFPHPVLRHELAHAFASSFGDRLFGVSFRWGRVAAIVPLPFFNLGLIEGAAVAAAWRSAYGMTPHQWARAMRELEVAPPLRRVLGYGFWLSAAGRSYTLAGSFCRYLIQRHGRRRFRELYRNGGDFPAAYGRSLNELERGWIAFLAQVPLTDRERDLAKERFRRRPVFKRPCVHEVARLERQADKLSADGKYRAAADVYRKACRWDPGEPGHLLGIVANEARADRPRPAIEAARHLWVHPAQTPPLRAIALRHIGNMEWRAGRRHRAVRIFRNAASYSVTEDFLRDLRVRIMALETPDRRFGEMLRRLFVPRPGETRSAEYWKRLTVENPRRGIAHYLYGTRELYAGRYARAASALARSLTLGLPDRAFRREALRRLARANFYAQRLDRARSTLKRLDVGDEPRGVRVAARKWIDRIDFWRRHGRRLGVLPGPRK